MANEGKLVTLVAPEAAEAVLKAMRAYEARVIGRVVADHALMVS